ncbi:MAG: histidine phosphatase family protein [Clostridium sp.]|nr:histidine phosphatase family protein [Clostridium sp.]
MKIIFIRHGEPDYTKDSLTENGWREADCLAERVSKWNVTDFYCSPAGRAKDTAAPSLKKMNRTAVTLDWMQEFTYLIDDPVTGRHGVPWDFVPSYWSGDPLMLDKTRWVEADVMKQNPDIKPQFEKVCKNFDDFLASYGYIRKDNYYLTPEMDERFLAQTVAPGNVRSVERLPDDSGEPVIVIFCHLGITCVVLSHLLNIPFPLLAHGFFLAPTSVTILSSERRWGKEAYFRVQAMGDTAHLLMGGEPLSPAGSFATPFPG